MGYCMSQKNAKFKIKASKRAKVLNAIKGLHGKESIHDSGGRHFSWVDHNFHKLNDLADIFRAWRWEITEEAGDVVNISFSGEKLGDDGILFEAIAKYVEKGSFIEMEGEDDSIWRWEFNGKTCRENYGTVTYDTDDEDLWKKDAVQFPRLLAEIRAIGLTTTQYGELNESMDLSRNEIDELLERAETEWQKLKAKV
jgi:hypothetical protein